MPAQEDPRPRSQSPERRRDAAFVLVALGAVLLLPPFVNIFLRDTLVFGLPPEVLYLFGLWLALVIGAFLLSRREPTMGRAGRREPPAASTAEEEG